MDSYYPRRYLGAPTVGSVRIGSHVGKEKPWTMHAWETGDK